MLKCRKNIRETLADGSCATFLSLPNFDVICDLILSDDDGVDDEDDGEDDSKRKER